MLRARIDRHRCIGAGNYITVAQTAFDWLEGDFAKADVANATSVDEELLRTAALAGPTAAVDVEEVADLLPWQPRGKEAPHQVKRTFMFTDIERSTTWSTRSATRRGRTCSGGTMRRSETSSPTTAGGDRSNSSKGVLGSPEQRLHCRPE